MNSKSAMTIHENYDLQALNTLAVPSVAQWFIEITDVAQLPEALAFQKQQQCSILILGGGSNVLLPEKIQGLVLKIATAGRSVISETETDVVVAFAAGENWHSVVMWCVEQGYYGIENLALIPGSVGAAPIQNIGAYGVELKNCFESLDAIDLRTGKIVHLDSEQCNFAYRESVFKHELRDQLIITEVKLRFRKVPALTLEYPALRDSFKSADENTISAKEVAEAVIAIRQSKLPAPIDIPNAGSFFKNPVVTQETYDRLVEQYPKIVAYRQENNQYKLAAGWLLDQAGWKGKVVDGISMHSQQALVLTNPKRFGSRQLLNFIEKVRSSIKAVYDIDLEIEPRVF